MVSSQVAEEALLSVFVTRSEVFEAVEFGGESDDAIFLLAAEPHADDYWTSLTPDKAFLARVFVEHCISLKASIVTRVKIVLASHADARRMKPASRNPSPS